MDSIDISSWFFATSFASSVSLLDQGSCFPFICIVFDGAISSTSDSFLPQWFLQSCWDQSFQIYSKVSHLTLCALLGYQHLEDNDPWPIKTEALLGSVYSGTEPWLSGGQWLYRVLSWLSLACLGDWQIYDQSMTGTHWSWTSLA